MLGLASQPLWHTVVQLSLPHLVHVGQESWHLQLCCKEISFAVFLKAFSWEGLLSILEESCRSKMGRPPRASRKSGTVLCAKPCWAGEHQTGSCGQCVQSHVFWTGRKPASWHRTSSSAICSLCSIHRMFPTQLFHLNLTASLWGG